MSTNNENYTGIMIATSMALGSLFSAVLLHENHASVVVQGLLRFGEWISGFAGLTGFYPALITTALFGGLLLMAVVAGICPKLEEYVAKLGAARSEKTLAKVSGSTGEQDRVLLQAKYGQKKPK